MIGKAMFLSILRAPSIWGHRRRPIQQNRQLASCGRDVEQLEQRLVLTPFYDLQILASTGYHEFESLGDLVSINNVVHGTNQISGLSGTVAFVGVTDLDDNGRLESGLYIVDSEIRKSVNPGYSNSNDRDFGRAVDLNDHGILSARDRSPGEPAQYFVRTWDSATPDDHTNVASANSILQPDFGKFSGLQTFTDINDHGDVAYIGQSPDASFRMLMYQPLNGPLQAISAFPADQPVPRPQLTADGRMLYRSTDTYLALRDPQTGVNVEVAPGYHSIGYASGISKDGQLIAFMGDKGDGLGVYLAYKSAGAYETVRIAGAGWDGWGDFDLTDAVRVNNTLMTERGVTVAFEAEHETLGRGLFTSRVSFIDPDAPEDWSMTFAEPHVHGAVPVVLVGDPLDGQAVTDVEFWNGLNDRNRGELSFWVRTTTGEKIIRALPFQVVALDFSPMGKGLHVFTPSNSQLLINFGMTQTVGWDANFAVAMQAAGLTSLTTTSAQNTIVDTVQSYFQEVGARIHVIGRSGEALPAYVPWTGPAPIPLHEIVRGTYQTVLIGAKSAKSLTDRGENGMAAPTTPGLGGIDYFNQVEDDFAVVFADRIFATPGVFTDPSTVPDEKLIQAISAITAHEIGHNFGLYHLEDNLTAVNNEIMRAKTFRDLHLTINSRFSSQLFPRESYNVDGDPSTLGEENSVGRLLFAAGTFSGLQTSRIGPDPLMLTARGDAELSNLTYVPTGQGPAVARLLLGIVQPDFQDSLPTFEDLGSGDIAQVLAAARLSVQSGTRMILLGSTDGTRLDIVGVPNGTAFDLAELDPTFLGISTDTRLQSEFVPGGASNGFQLFHIPLAGNAIPMGTVDAQVVPELQVSASDALLESGATFGLGATTPGGGPLSRVLTIRNNGSGVLTLGTVNMTGAGFSVTQPAVTSLAPGASTTIEVTLSDSTPGIGLTGTLTIPSNNPGNAFVLTVRGSVDDQPRVLSVTRVDGGTGPVRIQVAFSGRLQAASAANPGNYSIVADNGATVLPVSAAYSESGGEGRVVLTTGLNVADLSAGRYTVRFDGTKVVAFNGAALATSRDELLVANLVDATISTLGVGPNGIGVIAGPVHTGWGPPAHIAVADLNGDGIADIVSVNSDSGRLILQAGDPDGGYAPPVSITLVNGASPGNTTHPVQIRVADWDANGTTDLIVLDNTYLTPHIFVLLNDGQANFTDAPDTPIAVPPDSYPYDGAGFAVGDFTGDGLLDISLEAYPEFTTEHAPLQIIAKDPFLGYSVREILDNGRGGESVSGVITGDFNEDGHLDVMTNNSGYFEYRPGASLYLSVSTGGLSAARDIRFGVAENESGYEVDLGGGGIACDFNGDGHLDLIGVVDLYSNSLEIHIGSSIIVMEGDGHGNFTRHAYQALNRRGVSLIGAADLNDDGKADLLLRAPFTVPGIDTRQVDSGWTMFGDGQGRFTPGEFVSTAPTGDIDPGNYLLADVTGDGLADLVFGNTASGQIGLGTNDGTGVMQTSHGAGPVLPMETVFKNYYQRGESGLLVADLNRDGFPDQVRLVSDPGAAGARAIDILVGDSGGEFHIIASLSTSAWGGVTWIRTLDLNNDGWLDLVTGVGNQGGRLVSCWV